MVVKPTPEQIKARENERKRKQAEETARENLLEELRKESLAILTLAVMYAKNFATLGFDITERWVTAEQQGDAVDKIYQRGFADGILKGREIEGETIKKRLEVQNSKVPDGYDYLDDGSGQNQVSESLRNMVQPANEQNRTKSK